MAALTPDISSNSVISLLAEINNVVLVKSKELRDMQSGKFSNRRDNGGLDAVHRKISTLEFDVQRLQTLTMQLQEILDHSTERERATTTAAVAQTLEQQSHRKQQSNRR